MFFTITSVKLSRFRLNLVDYFSNTFFIKQCKLYLLTEVVAMGYGWLQTIVCIWAYSLRHTYISDLQVLPDSVKLVLGSGDNCLHCFVENVFEKKFTKFHLNRPSFMNVRLKTFLVCFLCPTV